MYSPFPVRCPRSGGSLQAPLLPSAQACPENVWCAPRRLQKEGTKEKKSERVEQRKRRRNKPCLHRSCGRHEVGCGQEQRRFPPKSGSSVPAPCSSSHSRTSSSDTALTASSSASAGTRLPTSVEERKSSTARLHLPSARRSRTFHRPFHLPVSFFTSAHRIFCCGLHSGHSLKRWSRVCV